MAETMKTATQSLIERAAKVDPVLAADIRAFAQQREFGLVFEHNRPEQMRLYGKPIAVGDTVQILPPRGEKEGAASKVMWDVLAIANNIATLRNDSDDTVKADTDDLVAVAEYDQPIYAGLKETGRVERGGDKPYQVVINGENHHALEALQFCYAGKVDCIYIDPPYNSGGRDWKYNNDYVGADDTYRHSKWLAMMERRLKLARSLLNPKDSVLIVTIDEKEYLRLGMLLEQLFPQAKIQMVSIVINPSGAKRDNLFSRSDEYAFFVLLGDAHVTHPEGTGGEEEVRWWYLRRTDYSSRRGTVKGGKSQFYPIYVDNQTKQIVHIGKPLAPFDPLDEIEAIPGATPVFPIREDGVEMNWGLTAPSLEKLIAQKVVRVSPGNDLQPYVFRYLSANFKKKIESGRWKITGEREDGSLIIVEAKGKVTRATTTWNSKSHDAGQYGTTLIGSLLGATRRFSFPKSLYSVEDTLAYFIMDKPNALVLDFFAGSGTTCHAVMRLNHQDRGHRRSICITNNEVSEAEEKELISIGARRGDDSWDELGICKFITQPRITSAITGRKPNGAIVEGDYHVKDLKIRDCFPISEGFEENAAFFDLTYQEPEVVGLGAAYSEVAPLLWLRAGCRGEIIASDCTSFTFSETYGILFKYSHAHDFIKKAKCDKRIATIFVVTDDEARYANIKKALPDRDVVRLYESYLRSFEIAAEGALS